MISSPVILAFGLGSPWLLGGLALGAIPIVIHLLHKRKFQETSWAAMRFLLEAAKKNSRRLRLEQLILLTVRMLILCLIALAMAQPFVETMGAFFQADLPTHRILVVDVSLSMGHQRTNENRLDKAKEIARQIVSASSRGDAINLVRVSGSEPLIVIREPSYQTSQVLKEIEQLELAHERGNVAATLKSLGELVKLVPEISRKEIVLLSDFQTENWSPELKTRRSEIQALLKSLGEGNVLRCIDVGLNGQQNAAVTSISSDEPFLSTSRTAVITVDVKNFGAAPLTDNLVELYVDDRLVEPKRIDIPGRSEIQLDFNVRFNDSGEHRIEARLEDDALMEDNRRWMAAPVKEQLNVLLVNGQSSGRADETATYFIERALAPSTRDEPWQGFIQPTVFNEGELPSINLSQYDCVFLCNVALLTQREADMLTAFVQGGGGLIISVGEKVQAENYNQRLFRDGNGILPAKLGNRVGSEPDAADAADNIVLFDPGDFEHPIVREFQGNTATGLERTITFRYIKAGEKSKDGARTALRFDSDDPAIIESPFGQGRTILVTTSADRSWGTWTTSAQVFVPLVYEMVLHSVSGQWQERQLTVGQTMSRLLPSRAFDMSATVNTPGDKQAPARVVDSDGLSNIVFDKTKQAGLYELSMGPPINREEVFAANIDTRESDLSKLDEASMTQELFAGVDFEYLTDWKQLNSQTDSTSAERGGLTRWLLFAALGLLFVEQMMAWRFAYGFGLLYCLVAFGFVKQAFWYGPIIGWTIAAAAVLLLIVGLSKRKSFQQGTAS
ncbi:MAG: hypothetical protein CMJ78_25875 [Planctomycetaceae bacterium]|nr:hypothetical protein [Planctomycetaceae bacterium]